MATIPSASADYAPTHRTTPTRKRERAAYDRPTVHAILDADFLCHVGYLADGGPVVLPTLYARLGERLYLHGSTGGRLMRLAQDTGIEVCVTVTLLDGLVLARSAMHHSANYRSVVVRGTAHATDVAERRTALDALVDHVIPGRAADTRPPSVKELAATGVLRLDLEEVSAKIRSGGVNDEPEDLALPHWAGVVHVRRVPGEVQADPSLDPRIPRPDYLTALASRL
jgi:uncharacterized protein